jgi:Family of unknown function (DUF6230)
VKDAQGDPAYGRTNWRRFAVAVGVPTAVAGALVVGIANGAFAASFAVSGQTFKISADRLDGTGFAQYGGAEHLKDGKTQIPVAVSGINKAKLTNLCQSVKMPGLPVTLTIRAGQDPKNPAVATDLLIGVSELSGDATFENINIGQDSSTLTKGGAKAHSEATGFGQEADGVVITGLHQTAYSTTAGTFALTGLNLKVNGPDKNGNAVECF